MEPTIISTSKVRGDYTLRHDKKGQGWYAEREIDGVMHRSRVYAHSNALEHAVQRGTLRVEPLALDDIDRSGYDKSHKTWLEHVIPKGTIGRYDLLPVFQDAELFMELTDYLARQLPKDADYIVAPESLGWILGSAIAITMDKGFIGLRKGNALPYADNKVMHQAYVDYSNAEKRLSIPRDAVRPGSRVIIVDEWIETGATMKACIALMEAMGCTVVGIATIGINRNPQTDEWRKRGFMRFISDDINVP